MTSTVVRVACRLLCLFTLMKDQVASLSSNSLSAAYATSEENVFQLKKIHDGEYLCFEGVVYTFLDYDDTQALDFDPATFQQTEQLRSTYALGTPRPSVRDVVLAMIIVT
ncbi:hypothetical protein EMCRGX_G001815 [Ephydatia muelleri]